MKKIIIAGLMAVCGIQSGFAGHYTPRGDFVSSSAETMGKIGDWMQFLIPASALIYSTAIQDWEGDLQLAESVGSTFAATEIIKYSTQEERPSAPEGEKGHTFPSGHTSFSFAGAGYWQMRYGWWVGAPMYLAAGFVGYSRVATKNHNWLDVGVGAALGIGANLIFTERYTGGTSVTVSPTTGGAYMHFSTKF